MQILIEDRILDRAIELWVRALGKPKFDNGDNSFMGAIGKSLCEQNADFAKNNISDYNASLEKFRHALGGKLKFLRDNHEEKRPPEEIQKEKDTGKNWVSEVYYQINTLTVDYHPCGILMEAATEAGLSESLFSIKSSISFYNNKAVQERFGYASETIYHYPLPNGEWLITKLQGEDMDKIINAALEGRLPELTIEPNS